MLYFYHFILFPFAKIMYKRKRNITKCVFTDCWPIKQEVIRLNYEKRERGNNKTKYGCLHHHLMLMKYTIQGYILCEIPSAICWDCEYQNRISTFLVIEFNLAVLMDRPKNAHDRIRRTLDCNSISRDCICSLKCSCKMHLVQ